MCHNVYFPVSLLAAAESGDSENWDAVDSTSAQSDSNPTHNSRYYLNVCHKIIQRGGAAVCPAEASICAVGKEKSIYNINIDLCKVY